MKTLTRAEFEALPDIDFFSSEDDHDDGLTATGIDEVLEGEVDNCVDWSGNRECDAATAERLIREHLPLGIDVLAWRREPANPEWAGRMADHFLDACSSDWGEDYGYPDGRDELVDDNGVDLRVEFMPRVEALMRELASRMVVWRCEEVARRTYTPDEVVDELRQSGWLNRHDDEA